MTIEYDLFGQNRTLDQEMTEATRKFQQETGRTDTDILTLSHLGKYTINIPDEQNPDEVPEYLVQVAELQVGNQFSNLHVQEVRRS